MLKSLMGALLTGCVLFSAAAQAQDDAMKAYIRNAAGTTPADELHRLADLKDRGVITDAEFAAIEAMESNMNAAGSQLNQIVTKTTGRAAKK